MVLATYAISIDPGISNTVQYIQKIVVTSNGIASGTAIVTLDGSGSNALTVNGTGRFLNGLSVSGNVGIGKTNPQKALDMN